MSETGQSTLDELQRSVTGLKQLRKSAFGSIVLLIIGVAFVVGSLTYSILKLRPLENQVKQKENDKIRLEQEIQEKNKEINARKERINKLRGLGDSLDSAHGKRKAALNLALELMDEGIPFKPGGRTKEGFDTSGFIDYILASPEVRLPLDIGLCNQACLAKLTTPAQTLGDLQPGDLIFYEYDQTLMYLGREKKSGKEQGIGMVFYGTPGKIDIVDVTFAKLRSPSYGKVPYGD